MGQLVTFNWLVLVRQQRLALLLTSIYTAIHFVIFIFGVSVLFAWQGYELREMQWWGWAVTFLVAASPGIYLPSRIDRTSDLAMWIQYISIVGPITYVGPHSSPGGMEDGIAIAALVHMGFATMQWARTRPYRIKASIVKNSKIVFTYGFLTIALLVALAIWRLVDFRIDLDWGTMYDRRLEAREHAPIGSVMAYLNLLFLKIIVPFTVVFALLRKNYGLLGLTVVLQVISFSFDGTKMVLYLPVLVFALFHTWRKRSILFFVGMFTSVVVLISVATLATGAAELPLEMFDSLVVRQTFAPNLVTSFYYDWFSRNPHNLMAGSPLLGAFVEQQQSIPMVRWIGYQYFGAPEAGLNTGIFGTGYADFGILGVFMTGLLSGTVLKWFDEMSRYRSATFVFIACSLVGAEWTNRGLVTSMISGGVALFSLLVWLYPDREEAPEMVSAPSAGPPVPAL